MCYYWGVVVRADIAACENGASRENADKNVQSEEEEKMLMRVVARTRSL